MRCLYCGKQLALIRRLTVGGEFCSEAHKHSYHEEYNKLALDRLLQAQSKSDEVKPPLVKPANAVGQRKTVSATPETAAVKSAPTRESESGWTTVPRKPAKQLSAT